MLRELNAPLKLVIAGNHDIALDEQAWSSISPAPPPHFRPEALQIIQDAKQDDVHYLTEGTYTFDLPSNGAQLTLYASQYTPQFGLWGFQYRRDDGGGHVFDIPRGVDIAMTHGPPRGILDEAGIPQPGQQETDRHAGCADLFRAIEQARPRVHCFGHIHEGWGAYYAKWKNMNRSDPQLKEYGHSADAETCIDAPASKTSERLRDMKPMTRKHPPPTAEQVARLVQLSKDKGYYIDYTGEEGSTTSGEQTLFLNAAIQDIRGRATQLPFIVDMLLHKAPNGSRLA
jgi:3',5'-cyclic AMP phosphodiesterase CpdA